MKYTEELMWILDKVEGQLGDAKWIQENVNFVHSLGLKCDSVGWCKLDLSNPKTPDILEKISHFCLENDWTVRGFYKRSYVDLQSDWFELVTTSLNDSTLAGYTRTTSESGENLSTCVLRAFHEPTSSPKHCGLGTFLVPESFRNACLRCGINDLDFCWAKDKGKYKAEQYFHVYAKRHIPKVATDAQLNQLDPVRIQAAGGWLPALAEVIHKFQQICLPECYLRSDLPEGGIVQTYVVGKLSMDSSRDCSAREVTYVERSRLLIHKDTAEMLLREKALSTAALRPAPVIDTLPSGYVWQDGSPVPRPTIAFREKLLVEYDQLSTAPRPIRTVSEKDAVKMLHSVKKERKNDFTKPLSRTKATELAGTAYAPMTAYYLVANGGYLSSEYELLPHARSVEESAAFFRTLSSEELLTKTPDGIVIAKCPDGDAVLLCEKGVVLRFSHEAPEVLDQWPSLPQFIADAIIDNE